MITHVGMRRVDGCVPLPQISECSFNLYSATDVVVAPGAVATISTGLAVSLPIGLVGIICLRPELAVVGATMLSFENRDPIRRQVIAAGSGMPLAIAAGEQVGTVTVYRPVQCATTPPIGGSTLLGAASAQRLATSPDRFHLYSSADVEIAAGQAVPVSAGAVTGLPEGAVGIVAARPGLSVIGSLNVAGRGPVQVTLASAVPGQDIRINKGAHIGTVAAYREEPCEFAEVDVFSEAAVAVRDTRRRFVSSRLANEIRISGPRVSALRTGRDDTGSTDTTALAADSPDGAAVAEIPTVMSPATPPVSRSAGPVVAEDAATAAPVATSPTGKTAKLAKQRSKPARSSKPATAAAANSKSSTRERQGEWSSEPRGTRSIRRVHAIGDGLGPYDIDELLDADAVSSGYLDLGSVLIPMIEGVAGSQIAIELTDDQQPKTVHLSNDDMHLTVSAFSAPTSEALWHRVSNELVDEFRGQGANAGLVPGVWGDEVMAIVGEWSYRVIGVDGPRWLIRAVLSSPSALMPTLTDIGRNALREAVVRRGRTAEPVNWQLAIELPEELAAQLMEAQGVDPDTVGVETIRMERLSGPAEPVVQEAAAQPALVLPDSVDLTGGPYDFDTIDDPAEIQDGYLDLGSILLPIHPEVSSWQISVEPSEDQSPSAVDLVSGDAHLSISAFGASVEGRWADRTAQIVGEFESMNADTAVEDGPWGAEVIATVDDWTYRVIGADGPSWLLRAVLSGPTARMHELTSIARAVVSDTVVRPGSGEHYDGENLPVELLRAPVDESAV